MGHNRIRAIITKQPTTTPWTRWRERKPMARY
jgi:hypothetical protein